MPQTLQYRSLWLMLGWLYISFIFYISLTPKPPTVDVINFDKLMHFTAYAVAMGWFSQLYIRQLTRLFYAVGFVCMGVGIEFLQAWGGERMFEYADMLANSLGVIVAFVFVKGALAQILVRFEQRLHR